jgi:peptidoglycan/LPS O-acetylase OafA/YrhL
MCLPRMCKLHASQRPVSMLTIEASTKNNNFNLARLILASSVILSHTYEATAGKTDADFFSPYLGEKISYFAVDGFFFLSGFLVYASLIRRQSAVAFFTARLARIWPGLIASIVLVVLIGSLFTTVPLHDYLRGETKGFILKNGLFLGGNYSLTGVECEGALCNINGSLWTIPWEIRCYALLTIIFLVGLSKKERMSRVIFPATIAFMLAWHWQPFSITDQSGLGYNFARIDRLWTVFALGIAAYIYKDKIKLSWAILLALLGLTVLQNHLHIHAHMESLFAGYLVLCLGFLTVKDRALSANWHDYSYGMYIYAFPVMTLLQQAFHFNNPWVLAAANFFCTLPVAALSWHLVEKPMVALAAKWTAGLRKVQPLQPSPAA